MFNTDFHHRLRSDGSGAEGVIVATTTLDDARNANGRTDERTAEASARIVSQSVFERQRRASERSV